MVTVVVTAANWTSAQIASIDTHLKFICWYKSSSQLGQILVTIEGLSLNMDVGKLHPTPIVPFSCVAMIELTFVTLFSFCLFPKRQECHSQNGIRGQKEAKRSGQIINGTDSEADKRTMV